MVCTFFGHGNAPKEIIPVLKDTVIKLIEENGVDMFYMGNHGHFDYYAEIVLKELKEIYPHIKYAVVLAYLPRGSECEYYDFSNTIYPEGLEKAPLRYAILKRNEWMLNKADYVITYVTTVVGGAAQFKEKAEKKKKIIIEISRKQR